MKLKLLIITLILSVFGTMLFAQSSSEEANLYAKEIKIEDQLPSINWLVEKAMLNSPKLKVYDAELEITKQQLLSQKRRWSNYIGVEGGAKYGLFDNLVLTQELGSEELSTATTEQSRYYVGAYLKIPLSNIIDKSNIKTAKAETTKVLHAKQQSVTELKQLIITQYYNIVNAHRTMILRVNAVESYRIQMLRAKLDFEDNQIPVSEYTRLNAMLIDALVSMENAKVEYEMALHILETTIGEKIELKNPEN